MFHSQNLILSHLRCEYKHIFKIQFFTCVTVIHVHERQQSPTIQSSDSRASLPWAGCPSASGSVSYSLKCGTDSQRTAIQKLNAHIQKVCKGGLEHSQHCRKVNTRLFTVKQCKKDCDAKEQSLATSLPSPHIPSLWRRLSLLLVTDRTSNRVL